MSFRKILKTIIVLLLFVSLFSCKKNTTTGTDDKNDGKLVENQTQYVRHSSVWAIKNEADITKNLKDVTDKILLSFGNKVTVMKSKEISKKKYYEILLPDKNTYWVKDDQITEKFIVINKKDVNTYTMADKTYAAPFKLQPGDYGVLIEESDGWYNVDFYAYRTTKEGEKKTWVGQKWIEGGFTDNLEVAKQAYYLYLAYYYEEKGDIEKAIQMAETAKESVPNTTTEISDIIDSYISNIGR